MTPDYLMFFILISVLWTSRYFININSNEHLYVANIIVNISKVNISYSSPQMS